MLAIAILFGSLVLTVGFGILIPLGIVNSVLSLKGRRLIKGLLGFGCIGAVAVAQWLSLAAVAENDHLQGRRKSLGSPREKRLSLWRRS
jgi:hypothetical protein